MDYSAHIDLPGQFRQAASYVDRILNGSKPDSLPIQRPNKYRFVFNLSSAKTLGLTVPLPVLTLADEVIEGGETSLRGSGARPVAARAQQAKLRVIGFIMDGTVDAWEDTSLAAFRRGLAETGYVEGRNVAIEYRASEGQDDKLPALAADLVRRQVTVIAGLGSTVAVGSAKAATTTIPIVFWIGGDPVKLGLVASFNRPGGNLTGVSGMTNELGPKRLGPLRQLLPSAAKIAALANSNNPNAEPEVSDLKAAGRSLGFVIDVVNVSNERDIDRFFATLGQRQVSALFLTADPLFSGHIQQIVALAADHAIPAMYSNRLFARAGGLMSYGTNSQTWLARAAFIRVRSSRAPSPLTCRSFSRPSSNSSSTLKTAKAFSFLVPPSLLAIADEVIE